MPLQTVEKLCSKKTAAILKVQNTALKAVHDFMYGRGVVQLMPVILSPITDPLCHSVFDASVEYYGQKLQLTKSMLLHKQIAVSSPHLERVYIVSPNVRLEKKDLHDTGRHLIEFSQVDVEFRGAKKAEFMGFVEDLLCFIVMRVKEERAAELKELGRTLEVPEKPFKRFESKEASKEMGPAFEQLLSEKAGQPFWIMDLEREFYDREDPEREGYYHNYDLVYPHGFGEALSGGERDFEHAVLEKKIRKRGQKPETFAPYMTLAKEGKLGPSAGGGLGVERLVRYLAGVMDIADVAPFAKKPGETVVV